MRSWARDLDTDTIGQVLSRVENDELLRRQPKSIAEILYEFVKASDQSGASLTHLEGANRLARALWQFLAPVKPSFVEGDWLHVAINHPAGTIAQYWCHSHSMWRRQNNPGAVVFGTQYREALTEIVQDSALAGQLGRSVLRTQSDLLIRS